MTIHHPPAPRGYTAQGAALSPFWAARSRHFISAIPGWRLYDLYRRAPATIEDTGVLGVGRGHRAALLTRGSVDIPHSGGGDAFIEGRPTWTAAIFFRFNDLSGSSNEDEVFGRWDAFTSNQRVFLRYQTNIETWESNARDLSGTQHSMSTVDAGVYDGEWHTVVIRFQEPVITYYRDAVEFASLNITDRIQVVSNSNLWQYLGGHSDQCRGDLGLGLVSTEAWDLEAISRFNRDPWGPVRRGASILGANPASLGGGGGGGAGAALGLVNSTELTTVTL